MFKPRFAVALLFLLAGDLSARCASRTFVQPPPSYSAAATRAQTVICEQLLPNVPAVQVAVARNGKLIWSAVFGEGVGETTKLRIGSISKPMTADVFALLVQEGKLDPDASIERYVPSLPAHLRKITPRQLAGHLSGIRHYAGNEFYSNVHYPSVTAGLAVFENDPLLFEPGTKYSYTTYGYSLLSAVLEGASGEAFRTLIRHLVFEPLHLRNTTLDDGRVPAFEADANGFRVAPHVDNSYKWAGGGVISTAEDVVKFGSAHLAPGRLTLASLDLLFTSMKTADGKPTDYGAGWNVHVNSRGDRVVSHFGSAVGGVSRLMVDRDTHVVAALITDVTDTDVIRKALSVTWPEVVSAFDQ